MKLNALFVFLCTTFSCVIADDGPYISDKAFDNGEYGPYPVQSYFSTKLLSPRLNLLRHDRECDDSLYTMITPRGNQVKEPMAMIMDREGHMVWAKGGYGQVYNLKVQNYKGKDYLTFWAGDDAVGGHGAGYYHMVSHAGFLPFLFHYILIYLQLDTTYREVYKIGAVGGKGGDLHEFHITEEGTALITVYEVQPGDLTAVGGKKKGKIWDCLIQEIVIETGELLFEWRAADHFAAANSPKTLGDDGGTFENPYDFYHMNSIDKDPKGNYIVSSRYMSSVTYIDGKTGDVIWVLGGANNSFTDLSKGKATNFAYQHDARWASNFAEITIFDNAAAEQQVPTSDWTRGLRIRLDQENMTATLVTEYINPNRIRAISQGSLQQLDNGNIFMGYGNSGAFTEYAANGTALCDWHMGPMSWFGSGDIQTYRAYKYDWHGYPTTKPDAKIHYGKGLTYYVSWNGATEVVKWVLQGATAPELEESQWISINSTAKTGFETSMELREDCPRYVRSLAVSADSKILGVSPVYDVEQMKVSFQSPHFLVTIEADTRHRYGIYLHYK